LQDTDTNKPLTRVIGKRTLAELLGIREESVILYLWGMNQLAYRYLVYFSVLKLDYILACGAWQLLMLDGDTLILLDVMKVVCTTCFILSQQSFNQAHHCLGFIILCAFCCY
jgi:hypothetical protein